MAISDERVTSYLLIKSRAIRFNASTQRMNGLKVLPIVKSRHLVESISIMEAPLYGSVYGRVGAKP